MIDTLTIARDLQDAGVAWKQAQAHAKAIADAAEKQHQDVATKDFVTSQISIVRTEISDLRGEMSTMEGNLHGEMSTMESNLRGEMSTMESNLRGEMSTMESNLRGEMSTMESNLRGEMSTMESNLRGEMRAQEVRLVRWIVVIVFSGMGILFAALRLFSS